ncbi:MAG: Crp/Fnr family transcriptional regulator [Bacteroidia bacterium]|nr:Crp/Fnr family transcriptional regulator [Bacteroidia bacterium]
MSPIFKELEIEEINSLINNCSHQIKQFSNKEVLAYSGEKVEKAMIVLEGKLQGEMIDFAGNSLKIEEIDPPQMVAAAFLYGPQSIFPVNLSALSEGKILIIYKNDFTKLLSSDQRVLKNYLNIVSGKAQFLSQKITFLSFRTIKEKIAYYLLQNYKTGNQIVIINQSQTGLAGMLGVARPSLARTIGEMEAEQLIRWDRNQVAILDLKSLQSILGK